jgi:LPPG:FO 2-phospho-L-lactate transferase
VRVALLSGGTGGAKLARGLYELLGRELAVVANTGDDLDIYGADVSPDPDLVSFWLADRIDERGWGIDGDSFNAMEMFAQLGHEIWFSLGDRDLALCLERRRLLESGLTRSQAQAALTRGLGIEAEVIPMSDDRVRTTVLSDGRTLSFHEFLIGTRGSAPIDDIRFEGAARAAASPQALAAIAAADAIVIGPSNPIISIGPILAIPQIRAAIEASPAPVVAVSPIVGGKVSKGPTAVCLEWAGAAADAAGVAGHYGSLIDAIVADEPVEGIRCLQRDTWMDAASARRELAQAILELAGELRDGR